MDQDIASIDCLFQRKLDDKLLENISIAPPNGPDVVQGMVEDFHTPLPNLRRLNLNENRITVLPDCLLVLRNLEQLRVVGNQLTSLENVFLYVLNLREYDASEAQSTWLNAAGLGVDARNKRKYETAFIHI